MKTKWAGASCLFICGVASALYAGNPFEIPMARPPEVTRHSTALSSGPAVFPWEFRSIDGTGNNPIDPLRGSAGVALLRHTTIGYGDGSGTPAGEGEPSAREISNLVCAQDQSLPNAANTSDFLWQWGQFVDHDIDLTPTADPAEPFNIPVPLGDPYFDPQGTGTQVIELDRSLYDMINGVRQQLNVITAFIDGSQVYGSDEARAMELRMLDGTGRLKVSRGNLLPYNIHGFPNVPDNSPTYFLAGDVRANEQVDLTAMQTLFMREHNYWARIIKNQQPWLNDDSVYYRARAIVGAEIQIITYRDFIPRLLGPHALPRYTGYNPQLDPGIENAFSTAAYRVGHSMLSPVLLRLDRHNHSIGDVNLRDAFFNPTLISSVGIEVYLRGLAKQAHQAIDGYLVDDVRNFLFGPPGAGGFDLAALNMQRGRDHGLPRYNVVRQDFGLAPKNSFADVCSDPLMQAKLASCYAAVDDIDAWVGALAEDHVNGGQVGELIFTVLRDQFTRLRDGDRFWYQTYLPRPWVKYLENQTLATIIRRNTSIGHELQRDVFQVPTP
jgi:peroxidase